MEVLDLVQQPQRQDLADSRHRAQPVEGVDVVYLGAAGEMQLEVGARLTRVGVDTNNGAVYLNGTVETPEQKTKAEQLAGQAKGVKAVVNNLQVQRR